jgi:hypothetical protein
MIRHTCNGCGDEFPDGPRWGSEPRGYNCDTCWQQNHALDAR